MRATAPPLPDVRVLPAGVRQQAAWRAHQAHDITPWPELAFWNSSPCPAHAQVEPGCRRCGVILRRHQRTGAAWLFLAGSGLLSDSVGLGKTATAAATIAMAFQTGELGWDARVVVVCRSAAVGQWAAELHRMLPDLLIMTAEGSPAERAVKYGTAWHICVIGPEMLAGARSRPGDLDRMLKHFTLGMVIYDDTDGVLNPSNRQAYAIKRLAERAPRRVAVHATPARKRLTELYSILEVAGGREVFGTARTFKLRHVEQGAVYFYQAALVCPDDHLTPQGQHKCQFRPEGAAEVCGKPVRPDPTHRKVRRSVAKEIGILRPEELRAKLAPLVLRRRAADCDDVQMPAIQTSEVWLDPTPAQKARYEEIRTGVIRRLRESGGADISHIAAMEVYTRAWQVCSGLASLDGVEVVQDSSAKLDWIMRALTGDLTEEKAVVFINFTPNVRALARRLEGEKIGHALIWGPERSPRLRAGRLAAFNDDPQCRVLVGTTAIEQSLNLQVARHLICADVIRNPMRMEQLAGRVARIGSVYKTVYVHFLLLRGTMEEHFLPQLETEAGMSEELWGDESLLFSRLSGRQILEGIAAG